MDHYVHVLERRDIAVSSWSYRFSFASKIARNHWPFIEWWRRAECWQRDGKGNVVDKEKGEMRVGTLGPESAFE